MFMPITALIARQFVYENVNGEIREMNAVKLTIMDENLFSRFAENVIDQYPQAVIEKESLAVRLCCWNNGEAFAASLSSALKTAVKVDGVNDRYGFGGEAWEFLFANGVKLDDHFVANNTNKGKFRALWGIK